MPLLLLFSYAAQAKSVRALYEIERASVGQQSGWAVIRDIPEWAKGATIYMLEGRRVTEEVASQADDLNGDGVIDELVFRVEFSDDEPSKRVRVVYSDRIVEHDYQPMVNAQMWLKNEDKSLSEKQMLSSTKDDMYRKLHHHGPAFESPYAAYRLYFDKKQSIDTYGKQQPDLELRRTMWYSTDEQISKGAGHDNLRVFGSISVGVLKGWNGKKRRMEHITEMSSRTMTIRAYGPLRTVVDLCVKGWLYEGRKVDMTSRYILYGDGGEVKVENRIEGEGVDEMLFTTGVMKIKEHLFSQDERDGKCAMMTIGEDFPENDTVRWRKERVALAVVLPQNQIVSRIDDAKSYLCQLRPIDGKIDYWFTMEWRKSRFLEWGDDMVGDLALFGERIWRNEALKRPSGELHVGRVR